MTWNNAIRVLWMGLFSLGQAVDVLGQPGIEWQRCFGGTQFEEPYDIQATIDGGCVATGVTLSSNGDVSSNFGAGDIWVIKLDSLGSIEWETNLGGSGEDIGYAVLVANDGGYLIGGSTTSNDAQVSGNHGDMDGWLVKISPSGTIQWRKCYGGSKADRIFKLDYAPDGGYIVVSEALSSDGDVNGNLGATDIWIFKVNNIGQILWSETFGGSNIDMPHDVKVRENGDIFILGQTSSSDGDVTFLHGGADVWLIKLDSVGKLINQVTFGGSSYDYGVDMDWLPNGTMVIVANTYSSNGDVSDHYGASDFWVCNIDEFGNLLWQKAYGGSSEDWILAIQLLSNTEMLLFGATQSNNGNVLGNDGGQDYWLVKTSATGTLQWQQTFGGTMAEIGYDLDFLNDGGVALMGGARSNNGDVSGNHGSSDYWIVKLAPEISSTTTPSAIPLNLYPNPAQNWFSINLPITESDMQISIADAQGRVVLVKTIRSDERLDISGMTAGAYTVSVVSKSGQLYTGKLVKG